MHALSVVELNVSDITPHPDNPRKHSKAQVRKIAQSIEAFGFRYPVLVDAHFRLISGHGRLEAAISLGMNTIPTLRADNLSPSQVRALMIADNRIAELADWDDDLLAEHFEVLLAEDLDFDIDVTGFDYGEIEVRVAKGAAPVANALADPAPNNLNVTARVKLGDVWELGDHRVICGDALDKAVVQKLMEGHLAGVAFTDPPYNLRPSDIGKICQAEHGAFAMGSGEMTPAMFTQFLQDAFAQIRGHCTVDARAFVCMDWRHLGELQAAGSAAFEELRNVCVWSKDRAGMGSLYRSQHELVFVWQTGSGKRQNNIQLGKNGRYRTNVWEYAAAASFKAEAGELENATQYHPTVKPVALIADALLDTSRQGDIVLDPFLGSGSTLIAAEQEGRRAFGIEIEPTYLDVVLARWETQTGRTAERVIEGGASNG